MRTFSAESGFGPFRPKPDADLFGRILIRTQRTGAGSKPSLTNWNDNNFLLNKFIPEHTNKTFLVPNNYVNLEASFAGRILFIWIKIVFKKSDPVKKIWTQCAGKLVAVSWIPGYGVEENIVTNLNIITKNMFRKKCYLKFCLK